jgi:hypothetical protein
MRLTLAPHPDTPCEAVREIAVELTRAETLLRLHYSVDGDLEQVVFPERRERARADELWKHSCFEAFLRSGDGYGEINLSPSNQWAAYGFDGYRSGMTLREGFHLLRLEDRRAAGTYELVADFDLTDLPPYSDWSIGLSAVIELAGGRRCFWALRHAPGEPDFHHPDAFAVSLPSSELP